MVLGVSPVFVDLGHGPGGSDGQRSVGPFYLRVCGAIRGARYPGRRREWDTAL